MHQVITRRCIVLSLPFLLEFLGTILPDRNAPKCLSDQVVYLTKTFLFVAVAKDEEKSAQGTVLIIVG
jgi:hypothetical protein